MKRRLFSFVFLGISLLFGSSCRSPEKTFEKRIEDHPKTISASAPVIIYKTKADYNHFVPILLSEDKQSLISYPDIKDVMIGGQYLVPTPLHKGFLLDNKGIGPQTAFLKYTYEEYAALSETPSPNEILQLILVKDAVKTMFYCGKRADFRDLYDDLNKIIDQDELSHFKQLK